MTIPDFSVDSRQRHIDLRICNELMEAVEMAKVDGRSLAGTDLLSQVDPSMTDEEFWQFVFRACNRYSRELVEPSLQGAI